MDLDGDQACIQGAFAQCVNGQFQLQQCSAGTTCVSLPLVNKPGTSVACDSTKDAEARMKAAGVTGGITGQGKSSGKSVDLSSAAATATAAASSSNSTVVATDSSAATDTSTLR